MFFILIFLLLFYDSSAIGGIKHDVKDDDTFIAEKISLPSSFV